jgi:hypothetical protein
VLLRLKEVIIQNISKPLTDQHEVKRNENQPACADFAGQSLVETIRP